MIAHKDYAKVPSIAAFAASTAAFFTLLEDRASYLAFYFTGDVLGTGLSPFLVIAFLCLLAAMVLTALAVIFEGDKGMPTVPARGDWKVLIPMVLVVGLLCGIVSFNLNASLTHGDTPSDPVASAPNASQPGASDSQPQSRYKTPTVSEEVWQGYSGEDYAAEDISFKVIAYQISGHGEVEAGETTPMDVLLNLYEDGMFQMTAYGRGNAYIYYGYWANVDDENLWFCVAYYTVPGQEKVCTIDYSYELTGMFDDVTINLALGLADGGQFVRQMALSGGDGAVKHTSVEKWLTDLGWTASDPSVTHDPQPSNQPGTPTGDVLFSFTSDSENYLLDCNADGTYTFTFVTAGLVETGTWVWKDWAFTLTDTNGTVTTAELDGESHALNLHFVAAVNSQVNRDFTCASDIWGRAFGGQGSYEPAGAPSEPSILFSFTSDSENYLLDCNADGTYTFTFVTAGLVETGTWAWKDWAFTLTDTNGTVTTAELDGESHALNLHFVAAVNSQVNRDFTCASDIWGQAFGGQGSYEPT